MALHVGVENPVGGRKLYSLRGSCRKLHSNANGPCLPPHWPARHTSGWYALDPKCSEEFLVAVVAVGDEHRVQHCRYTREGDTGTFSASWL